MLLFLIQSRKIKSDRKHTHTYNTPGKEGDSNSTGYFLDDGSRRYL